VADLPRIDSRSNYCELHSPIGFVFGEPGEPCTVCRAPLTMSAEQVSRCRTMRNQVQAAKRGGLPVIQIVGHDFVQLA
jgi:hypothetical protein